MASEPTTTTRSPSSLLIRAPLSPEENENENDPRAGSDGGLSAEEDFETASDPDDEVLDSSLSPEAALLPRTASMPKARVSGEDEVFEEELEAEAGDGDGDDGYGVARVSPADVVGENPSAVDEEINPGSEEGSGELPRASEPNSVDSGVGEKESVDSNLEESSKKGKDEKLGENQDESNETVVEPVDSGVGVEESQNPNPEVSPKDGVLGFGGEDEKVGDNPKRVEKDVELKGDDGDEEAASPAVEGAQESKPVDSVPVDEEKEDKDGVDLEKFVEAESNGGEADKAGAGDADVSEENSDKVNISTAENLELESNKLNSGVVGVENDDEGVGGGSNSEAVPAVNAENLELELRELKSDVVEIENGGGLESDTVTKETQAAQASLAVVDPGNGSEDAVGVEGDEKGDILLKDSATVGAEVAVESGVSRNQEAGENNVASPSEEASSLSELSEGKLDALNESETVDSGTALNQDAGENKGVTQSEEVLTDLHAQSNEGETEVVADDGDVVSSEEVESGLVLVEETKSRDVVFGDAKSLEADDDENVGDVEAEEEEEGLVSDGPARVAILESSETAKQIIKELEGGSSSNSSQSGFGSSRGYPNVIDGQIASDSDEEVDTDDEGDGKELFDSAALAALLKAATGGDGGITISSGDSTRIFSVDRPAGLGSSVSSLKPLPPRPSRSNIITPSNLAVTAEPENNMDEEEKKLHEKVEMVRVKFLRLIQRLGHSADDTVASQVLYRLSLAEGIKRGRHMLNRAPNLENARNKALQLEAEGKEDLDFSCNILVLGKSGVGKSATINSIFGEEKSKTSAFESATTSVKEISGIVDGVKICVIDTPGLKASAMEQQANRKILSSIKKYTKSCPPDIVLYVDRMDTQTRDFNDLPLLRSITSVLGSSIWFNAIVALTHAASAPPDGLNGTPLNYEVFIAQRSHVVQHSIRQAASDMRLMNPVALVENHPSCRRNREGEKVLPNGQSWRPQMLLLCYSSKILTEANSLLKLQDANPGKLFGFRMRGPPLPFLLSSLLQSRPHPKLSSDQGIDNGDSDIDLDDLSDSDQEDEEDDYDQLPPFKPLKKAQLAKLPKEQRKAYFEEYDYRVKLLQKKQWKEEIRRLKEMKKRGKGVPNEFAYGDMADDYEQDAAPAAVPVPLPDMVLPPTFDCDNPAYRYRFLEPTSQLLTRPVLDTHGWDHDCGYDGVSIEENLALLSRFPAGVSVQITKDKKDFNIHLDSSISAKHGENASTLAGLDIQTVGKQLAYILRSETKFKNFKKNKTTGGISVTFLGETVATGLKIEDQISIGRWLSLVASTGAIRAQGDTAYGGNLEVRLRDKDYPISQILTTLGLSLMRWRGDLALGANLQTQFPAGRNTKVVVRGSLNNKLTGQLAIKTSSSEQLPFALWGVVPMALVLFRKFWSGESYPMQ